MKKSLVLLSLVVASLAGPVLASEAIVTRGLDLVRISDKACANDEVLARVSPEWRDRMRQAFVIVDGQAFHPCWIGDEGLALLVYEDGDQGTIPLADFRSLEEI